MQLGWGRIYKVLLWQGMTSLATAVQIHAKARTGGSVVSTSPSVLCTKTERGSNKTVIKSDNILAVQMEVC
jgi:hypothetical protein